MRIRPRDILYHMQVPKRPGLYVLGVFESRVTVYSQQVRALNLIYSLFEDRWIKDQTLVAVVGAGVAGLTAAEAAASCGAQVTVLEQLSEPLALIGRNDKRWLHPHIYEWPEQDPDLPKSLNEDAALPLLNWQAGTVDKVREQLIEEYRRFSEKYVINFKPHVSNVKILRGNDHLFSLTWNEPVNPSYLDQARRNRVGQFDIVILAVGFGLERQWEGLPFLSYWSNDRLDEEDASIRGRAKRYLISGTGDGGLIDLLRIRIKDFRHDQIVGRLTKNLLDEPIVKWLTDRLEEIEQDAKRAIDGQKPYEARLNEEYQRLSEELNNKVDVQSRIGFRPDTRAVLTSRDDYPLSLRTSILNRLLYSLLPDVNYLKGPWESKRNNDGSFNVTFVDGTVEAFDEIIIRHGPEAALRRDFPDVWEQCESLRERNVLDQTRFPISQGFFQQRLPADFHKAKLGASSAVSMPDIITIEPLPSGLDATHEKLLTADEGLGRTAGEPQATSSEPTKWQSLRETQAFLVLNLSDLHFRVGDDVDTLYALLAEDLRDDLACKKLDAVILSGDIANKAKLEEYELARQFVRQLQEGFSVPREALLIVPGNHDVDWSITKTGFRRVERRSFTGSLKAEFVYVDPRVKRYLSICDEGVYRQRFANFARFYEIITGDDYSLDYDSQYCVKRFPEAGLILVGLNSAYCLDHLRPGQPAIFPHVINRVLDEISKIPDAGSYHKVAVWHHPIHSREDDRIRDASFAERLTKFGFRIGIHGHVHELRTDWLRYDLNPEGRHMDLLAAGTFGAPTHEVPFGAPWEYNLLRFHSDKLIVESRYRTGLSSPWRPLGFWQEGGTSASPRYTIALRSTPKRPTQLYTRAQLSDYLHTEGMDAVGYRIAVEANIFDSAGALLLQRRGPRARDERGKFEGIGGDMRHATNLHEALHREIKAEIGEDVVVNIDALFEVRPVAFEEEHGSEDWIVVSYLCRLISGIPRAVNPDRTSEVRFFKLDEAYALPDTQLSRSTSRFLTLYRAKYGNRPYYEVVE